MAEIFNAMKRRKRERRAANLAKANTDGWTQHTEYHWYRDLNGKKLDYWPSSGKWMYEGRVMNGVVQEFIDKRSKPMTDELSANVARVIADITEKCDFNCDVIADAVIDHLKQQGLLVEWRPIEKAPKDGTRILAYNPKGKGYNGQGGEAASHGGVCVAQWRNRLLDDAQWCLPHCCDGVSYIEPTHFMPLPPSPTNKE